MILHESWLAFDELALQEHFGASPINVKKDAASLVYLSEVFEKGLNFHLLIGFHACYVNCICATLNQMIYVKFFLKILANASV